MEKVVLNLSLENFEVRDVGRGTSRRPDGWARMVNMEEGGGRKEKREGERKAMSPVSVLLAREPQ